MRKLLRCAWCGGKIPQEEELAGKCGLCGAITCDCCLEDHIIDVHPDVIQYGSLNRDNSFEPLEVNNG